jgi:hypothetical protein
MFLPLEFYEGISLHMKKHNNISLVTDRPVGWLNCVYNSGNDQCLVVDHLGRKLFRINVAGWFSSS